MKIELDIIHTVKNETYGYAIYEELYNGDRGPLLAESHEQQGWLEAYRQGCIKITEVADRHVDACRLRAVTIGPGYGSVTHTLFPWELYRPENGGLSPRKTQGR